MFVLEDASRTSDHPPEEEYEIPFWKQPRSSYKPPKTPSNRGMDLVYQLLVYIILMSNILECRSQISSSNAIRRGEQEGVPLFYY